MWTIFWQTVLLALVGTIIIRVGGRKSIAQMTIPQLTIMLALGTVLGSEVAGKGLAATFLATGTFMLFLIAVEWVTLKWNKAETVLKGEAVPVINNGQLMINNLQTLRMSVDDLEKRLRLAGISRIEDVKTGTIEDNGELGYELMPHAKPVTMGELEKLLKSYFPLAIQNAPQEAQPTIFNEVVSNNHSEPVPKELQ